MAYGKKHKNAVKKFDIKKIYSVEEAVGIDPSVVQRMVSPVPAAVMVTVCAPE